MVEATCTTAIGCEQRQRAVAPMTLLTGVASSSWESSVRGVEPSRSRSTGEASSTERGGLGLGQVAEGDPATSEVKRITLPSGSSTIAAYGPTVWTGDIRPWYPAPVNSAHF
jgi:hypothetical protein